MINDLRGKRFLPGHTIRTEGQTLNSEVQNAATEEKGCV